MRASVRQQARLCRFVQYQRRINVQPDWHQLPSLSAPGLLATCPSAGFHGVAARRHPARQHPIRKLDGVEIGGDGDIDLSAGRSFEANLNIVAAYDQALRTGRGHFLPPLRPATMSVGNRAAMESAREQAGRTDESC